MSKRIDINPKKPSITTTEHVIEEGNELSEGRLTPYNSREKSDLPRGSQEEEQPDGSVRNVEAPELPRSQVSNYHLVRVKDMTGLNYPMIEDEMTNRQDLTAMVTAKELIQNPRGASIYRKEDFMYAREFGKIPNNRMLTLRRFRYPTFDDIFTAQQLEPDVSRMITYMTDDINKLEELVSFTAGLRWKELESTIEQTSFIGNQTGADGLTGRILNTISPSYGQDSLRGKNQLQYDPYHDTNKVHGAVDVIANTHIRDIGLDFSQEFSITFPYTNRSYNGVSGRAVMLDILSNVLLTTTNEGVFWGGSRYTVGRRRSKYADNLRFMTPRSFDDFLNQSNIGMKKTLAHFSGEEGRENAAKLLKEVITNVANIGLGKLLDKVGRPSIPVMRSLLSDDNIGEWHLTVGNPNNPIAVIGNLMLTSTEIKWGSELGYDDFPNELFVTCTLKHAKPRDRASIENMFNCGRGRIYMKPKEIFKPNNITGGEVAKNNPKFVQSLINKGVDKLLGHYDKAAIERNEFDLWRFAQKTSK